MILRSKMHRLVPMLALSMTLAMAASAHAGTDVSLQINFGSTPHWVAVPGTSVREIRQGDRTDYDMFQYGRSYYAYNNSNGRWYSSRRSRGRFVMIDDRSVPRELRRVPRSNWRNYPSAWDDQGSGGSSASMMVNFGSTPHWAGVSGTRVEVVSAAERPDYDVFRYGNSYYAYNSNRWYTSSRETGQFTAIDDRSVPTELSKVPRDQWRNYPASWQSQDQDQHPNGTPPGLDKKNGVPPGQDKKNRNHHGNG